MHGNNNDILNKFSYNQSCSKFQFVFQYFPVKIRLQFAVEQNSSCINEVEFKPHWFNLLTKLFEPFHIAKFFDWKELYIIELIYDKQSWDRFPLVISF